MGNYRRHSGETSDASHEGEFSALHWQHKGRPGNVCALQNYGRGIIDPAPNCSGEWALVLRPVAHSLERKGEAIYEKENEA